jgi:hypothetical protein
MYRKNDEGRAKEDDLKISCAKPCQLPDSRQHTKQALLQSFDTYSSDSSGQRYLKAHKNAGICRYLLRKKIYHLCLLNICKTVYE